MMIPSLMAPVAGRTCALCEKEPVEPVTWQGEQACAECLIRCQICTEPTLIGTLVCDLCAVVHHSVDAAGRAA